MSRLRAELNALLRGVSETALRVPGAEGEWSSADVLAHFAGYTRGVADLLGATHGAEPKAPDYNAAPGLSDDDFNDIVVRFWRGRPIAELLSEESDAFEALVAEVKALPAGVLSAEGYFDFARGRSLEAILPAQSYGHYREHLPSIRRVLS